MYESIGGFVSAIGSFALLGYFFWGMIKRDIVLGANEYSGKLRFKGFSAVLISLGVVSLLIFANLTLKILNFNIAQLIVGIIFGLIISFRLHKMMLVVPFIFTEKTSKKQFNKDFIFWVVFATVFSLMISFFVFMASRSMIIGLGSFLIPFSVVFLFGYAFSKFNSGR